MHRKASACVKSETSARVKDCWWGARARLDPPSRTRLDSIHATDLFSTVPSYHGAVLPSPSNAFHSTGSFIRPPFSGKTLNQVHCAILRSTTLTYKNGYCWLRSSVSVCETSSCCLWRQSRPCVSRRRIIRLRETRNEFVTTNNHGNVSTNVLQSARD